MTNDNGPRATGIADQVGQVGQRLPEVIETVREGAIEGARTIQALPDVNQRLLAAFSLGLGLGLSVAGAPRVAVVASLAPAILVAATIVGADGSTTRKGS